MIERDRPSALRLFFAWRGSIVAHIVPQIVGFALYAAAVVAAVGALGLDLSAVGIAPLALVGITLSIYLSFRNSAAYDRWWEARGSGANSSPNSRTLPRAAEALLPDPEARRRFLLCFLGFCHLLRGKLRDLDVGEQTAALSGAARSSTEALRRMGRDLAEARRSGDLDPIGHRILEERLTVLTAIETGCERIAGTPLPFAYTLLLHRTAYLVCLLLPFGLVATAGWATPLFTALDRLHLLRARPPLRGARGPLRHRGERPCPRQPLPHLRDLGVRGPRRARPAPAAARGYYLS